MTDEKLNQLRAEFDDRLDALMLHETSLNNALLGMIGILLPALVKHRLLDVDAVVREIDELISKKGKSQQECYATVLKGFQDDLLRTRAENNADLH